MYNPLSTQCARRKIESDVKECFVDYCKKAWVKDFRIINEFRILKLAFHRKSASNAELGRI